MSDSREDTATSFEPMNCCSEAGFQLVKLASVPLAGKDEVQG